MSNFILTEDVCERPLNGIRILLVKHSFRSTWHYLTSDRGWGNGYVLLPKWHPAHGKDYDELEEMFDIDVHGGLTFAGEVSENMVNNLNNLVDDEYKLSESDIGMWCIGFDTMHYGDNLSNCSKEFVKSEALRLKEQLERIISV